MMHHNYIGGLMVHTLECLRYAETNIELSDYKFNRDNIMAACMLHDIGKILSTQLMSKMVQLITMKTSEKNGLLIRNMAFQFV